MIKGLLLCASLFILLFYEYLRWDICSHGCRLRYAQNAELLETNACRGPRVHGACESAARENDVSHLQCTAQQFWHQSEYHRLYHLLAGSYWSLLGVVIPIALFLIHRAFSSWEIHRTEERMERHFDKQQVRALEWLDVDFKNRAKAKKTLNIR